MITIIFGCILATLLSLLGMWTILAATVPPVLPVLAGIGLILHIAALFVAFLAGRE